MNYKESQKKKIEKECEFKNIEKKIIKDKGLGYFGSPLQREQNPSLLKKLNAITDRVCKELSYGK